MLVQSIPHPASAPAGPAVMGISEFQTDAAGSPSNLHVTDAVSLAGSTPNCAWVVLAGHDVANGTVETATARMSIGASTAAGVTYNYSSTRSRDGVASAEVRSVQGTGNIVRLLNVSSNSFEEAFQVASHIANGISFSRGAIVAPDFRGHVALFDDSVSGYQTQLNLGTGTSPLTVTPTFEADVVILWGPGTVAASFQTRFGLGIGIATRSGDQRSVMLVENDGAAAGAPLEAISTAKSFMDINPSTGALTYDLSVGNFTATTFDVTPSANAGSDIVNVLALNFPGNVKLMDLTTPTSTGDMTISGIGFTPSAAIAILTNLEATDPWPTSLTTSDLMASISVCMFNANKAVSSCLRLNSGEPTIDTASNCQLLALLGGNGTATDAIKATLVGFGSDTCTLNFSAVQGTAKKGFILFME